MKKIMIILLAAAITAGSLSACGSVKNASVDDGDKLRIVTTIFPEYDWVMNILGKNSANAEVTMLLDNGVDLHSYQPTADDIMKIISCDLFIYVGGESDEWVEDALKETVNKDMAVIDLLDVLGDMVKEEETVEGMQEEEHEHHHEDADEHEGEEADEHEHEEETEYDEHVWLSLRNAKVLIERISSEIQRIDPDHAGEYSKNTDEYVEKLSELDREYDDITSNASIKTILFGDRFPFRYMADDYGLSYYAAFAGCSAESEASFETVTFLAKKVDELGLHSVVTIEGTDHRIAETIVQNTESKDQKILSMDSMQSTTAKDVENGTTYLAIMKKNRDILMEALK